MLSVVFMRNAAARPADRHGALLDLDPATVP